MNGGLVLVVMHVLDGPNDNIFRISLPGLLDGNSQFSREEFLRYAALRADYHSAKIGFLISNISEYK
jgi:hypothetical protein